MRKLPTLLSAAAVTLALTAQLSAGGFWLQLGNPEANREARGMKAVLTVKAFGCHEPEKARVTGTAEGIVDGKRRSIPLTLAALSEPGMFALTEQWPTGGKWVIQLVGDNNDGAITSALVSAGSGGIDRKGVKLAPGKPSMAEIEARLRVDSAPAAVARK